MANRKIIAVPYELHKRLEEMKEKKKSKSFNELLSDMYWFSLENGFEKKRKRIKREWF